MFQIQPASKKDSKQLLRYIKELAAAEKFADEVSVTQEDVEENLFSSHSLAKALIFYNDKKPCGFAVYYHTFSTTTGKKGLHLDDLYIEPSQQRKGFGKRVLAYLAELAEKTGCARFEWWTLKTNAPAIKFYEHIGAKRLDEILIFRLDVEGIQSLSASLKAY